ncbi:MAG: DegT/DnrJ/EryC1/StrS family aminotransferase [bacterium]|nr:DegT/DnrJ/EryC1/StrS family aminotransferase [bacterium]
MKKKIIKWWSPRIGEEEFRLVKDVLASNYLNDGDITRQFETKIASLLKVRQVIAVTSGTVALSLSLKSLGVGCGDEVIVPDITFIATANAAEMCGAKVILVDIDQKTSNIDVAAIKRAITKKTKAIVPVHVTGRGADMGAILKIAKENNIFVVEDAAEALFSKQDDKYLGTLGDTGCFSLSPNKTITTGQGGFIATDNDKLAVRLRELKDQGRPKTGTGGDDFHNSIGYNFKFTNLQAAVGLGQLNYLSERTERMKKINRLYFDNLKNIEGLKLFEFKEEEIPQWTDAVIDRRDELEAYLKNRDINCRKYWFPLHTQLPYKLKDDNFANSTKLSPKALWLPSCFDLSDDEVMYVVNTIKEFYTI